MDPFDIALVLYRDGKLIIDASRELAVANDLLRWAREDLEDILLDLKRAWIARDEELVGHHRREATTLLYEIAKLVSEEGND